MKHSFPRVGSLRSKASIYKTKTNLDNLGNSSQYGNHLRLHVRTRSEEAID